MNYKPVNTFLVIALMMSVCHLAAVVPQEAELKAQYKSFRDLVDTFNKYTRISKRSMTDKEWQELKATAKRVGMVGSVLVLALLLKKVFFDTFSKPVIPEKKQEKRKTIMPIPGLTSQQTELREALINRDFDKVLNLVRIGIKVPKYYLRLQGNILHEIITPDVGDVPDPQLAKAFSEVIDAPIHKAVIRALINQQDKFGVTPLFATVHQIHRYPEQVNEYLKIMDILIKKSGDTSYKTAMGPEYPYMSGAPQGTLLHAATHITDRAVYEQVKKWLQDKGVNTEIKNTKGEYFEGL